MTQDAFTRNERNKLSIDCVNGSSVNMYKKQISHKGGFLSLNSFAQWISFPLQFLLLMAKVINHARPK